MGNAEEGTRTPTAFRPPAPKAGASANSATSALPDSITGFYVEQVFSMFVVDLRHSRFKLNRLNRLRKITPTCQAGSTQDFYGSKFGSGSGSLSPSLVSHTYKVGKIKMLMA